MTTPRSRTQNQSTYVRGLVSVVGSFIANGAGAITNSAANIFGLGFSVVRTGVGLYTLTLSESLPVLLSAQLTVQAVAATPRTPQLVSYVPATKTLVVRVVDAAGAAADLAIGDRLHMKLDFTDTTNKPSFGV